MRLIESSEESSTNSQIPSIVYLSIFVVRNREAKLDDVHVCSFHPVKFFRSGLVSIQLSGVSPASLPEAQDVSHEYGNFLLNSNIPIWLQTFIFFTHDQVSVCPSVLHLHSLYQFFTEAQNPTNNVTFFYKCRNDKKSFIQFD